MSTTKTDSPTLSASPSPLEVIDFIEARSEQLAAQLSATANRLIRRGANAYAATGDNAAWDGFISEWEAFVNDTFAPEIAAMFQLGMIVSTALTAAFDTTLFNQAAVAAANQAAGRASALGNNVLQQVRLDVEQAVKKGAGPRTLANTLIDNYGLDPNAAMTLARTELMSAFNTGDRASIELLPPDERPTEHMWQATEDGHTRPDHRDAHQQVRPIDVPFTVGGWPMLHPHAPGAPAEQVVNCRCVALYFYPGDKRPDGTEAR